MTKPPWEQDQRHRGFGSRVYGGLKDFATNALIWGGLPAAGFWALDTIFSPSEREMLKMEYQEDLGRGFHGSFDEWLDENLNLDSGRACGGKR